MITITQSAKDYLYSIAQKNDKDIVSFGVKGGGCAGFSYEWGFLDTTTNKETIIPIKDNVILAIDKVSEMCIFSRKY